MGCVCMGGSDCKWREEGVFAWKVLTENGVRLQGRLRLEMAGRRCVRLNGSDCKWGAFAWKVLTGNGGNRVHLHGRF